MTSLPASLYPIRPITEDELDRFHLVIEHAFHGSPQSASDRQGFLSRFEAQRSLAAFDGASPVGVTGIFSFQFSVPGAIVPAAGVTLVSVLPSHRRRGVLRSLMRRQLADVRAAGESIAVLWASEAEIYGRYGYGQASWQLAFNIRRGEGALKASSAAVASAAGSAGGLRLRLVEPSDARAELAKVYDDVMATRPGFFARNEHWWQRRISDPEDRRNGAGPLRCLLAEDDSGPRGYSLYAGFGRWEQDTALPDGKLEVRELIAADADAGAALWANLLSRDLTTGFHAQLRPVDDPLLSLLADPRRARSQLTDGVWVRLVDVSRALAGRRYACPVDLVIEVRDSEFGSNAGLWRLRTDPGDDLAADGLAATCEPAAGPADVALDVTELGAAYLGGVRLGTLGQAGLVTELRPGAVRRLSAAMSWDPAPWCPMIF